MSPSCLADMHILSYYTYVSFMSDVHAINSSLKSLFKGHRDYAILNPHTTGQIDRYMMLTQLLYCRRLWTRSDGSNHIYFIHASLIIFYALPCGV